MKGDVVTTRDQVLDAIMDGAPLDWDALGRSMPDANDALRGLETLGRIAGAFRTHAWHVAQAHDVTPDPSSRPAAPSDEPALFAWGHLIVRQRLGEGQFAEVYRAWDPTLHREVALKLARAPASLLAPRGWTTTMLEEARLAARIRHPNVVTVHGADLHDGRAGIWTDLLTGRTLEQHLEREGPFGSEEAALIGRDLCRALTAVHGAGLVHGDVTTRNVMRQEDGTVVLFDFGAATDPGLGTSSIKGTPLAMAPERLRGAPPHSGADIYALGTLLYRIVSGTYAYEARTIDELRVQQEREAVIPLLDRCPKAPEGLVRVVQHAMAPAHLRYPTAAAMEAALVDAIREMRPAPEATGFTGRRHAGPRLRGRRVRSLVVLPFTGGGTTDDYFADGLTEELIALLSRVGSLATISRASAMRYKDSTSSLKEVAAEIGVDAVVHGSVRRSGDRARIVAHLTDGQSGLLVWSSTYDRHLRDSLSMQADVARAVLDELRLYITPDERSVIEAAEVNPQAHLLYLKGRYHWNQRTPDGVRRSVTCFRNALNMDPLYAQAHAGLANAYNLMGNLAMVPPRQAFPLARGAATQALALDRRLAEAYTARGAARGGYDWDLDGAEQDFHSAIDLNPGDATAHQWLAEVHVLRGRRAGWRPYMDRAMELDPLSSVVRTTSGWLHHLERRYDEAVAQFLGSLELDPEYALTHLYLGLALEQRGFASEAVEALERARRLAGDDDWQTAAHVARVHAGLGNPGPAHALLDRFEREAGGRYVSPVWLALVHAGLGAEDRVLDQLERAVDDRSDALLFLGVDPVYDGLRSDRRFRALLPRIGLPLPD